MAFGATPAGNRLIAASQALGAPKGVGGTKAPSKLPMRPQKGNPMPRHNANPHPAQHSQPAHAGPQEHLGLIGMTPQQLNQRATSIAQAQGQTELAPLRTQATELKGTEAASQSRFKALGEAQQGNLAKLGEQAQQGALTAQNQAANNALKSAQSVETSGQAQSGLTGGYLSPEAKAELAAEGQRASGEAGAGKSLAEQSGTNENNYMANLRAAAAAKVTEGSSQIASQYGKALKENSAKQGEVAGRIGANTSTLANELTNTAFNQNAVREKLKLEGGYKEAEIGLGKAKVQASLHGQGLARQTAKEKVGLQAGKLALEGRKQNFGEWATQEKVAISKLSAADKARYDAAQIRVKEAQQSGKTVSPAEGRKYISKLSTAESIAKGILGSKNQGRGDAALQAQAREELRKKGASQDVISAALNLAVYHRLSTADQAAAISYGLTPNLRPEWFRKK